MKLIATGGPREVNHHDRGSPSSDLHVAERFGADTDVVDGQFFGKEPMSAPSSRLAMFSFSLPRTK